ncbi:hypothetical protein TTHERM_00711820 (macronuclear) [Tetrahymena thermophila SB210]|uniref:Uncharacterized protein n=1 Tax=Tetrahymena thermophila (strain SB210) TaxID=312017 RepID=Q24D11_TETTS|nr:hypothetical protein TTHERM_00711820 [Tetrahymena thermophila SB210]EAS05597.2 hypothetical protein TTHERM_00711820 [Tetrahymena thermophila SB210]|eukprot:XP_001025842.2 hypothetical protein TTHERM_00711820 [Tetrahymena thermophila SB210]
MSRAKVNSDSLQIIGGGGGGGEIYMTNSEVNQYSNLQDNLSSQDQIGMFSFRNQKLNSLHSRNNEQYDKESVQANKQGQNTNQNISQNHSPINQQNQFYSFNQYPNQSGRQSQCSQQSIPYNPSSSLQTFGNASNMRRERESSNSQIESTLRQTQHHRYNSDASIINHTIKTAQSELVSQSFGINQGTQQNHHQNFKMYNNSQQNLNNTQLQNQENQHSYPNFNNSNQAVKNQDPHLSQKNNQNNNNQQERTNNYVYEENNLNKNQQQKHMRSNSLQQNMYQNNMKIQGSVYSNSNNTNNIQYQHQNSAQQNFQKANNSHNQNFKNQSDQNQVDQQQILNIQNHSRQEQHYQKNKINQTHHYQNQSQDYISQGAQQSHFNSQQSNNYQSNNQNHSNYNSQKQQQFNQNINQTNGNSQKYQPPQEKQYISIDKSQISSINSGRNNQSNSQSLYFISPRSDSVFFNQNSSVQSQQGVFHINTYKLNNHKSNTNQQPNSNSNNNNNNNGSGFNNNSITKEMDFIKDSTRKINQDLSPEDEFLIKFKKMKNNQFLNRPQSNNPEQRRKQKNDYPSIENEFNFTENINNNPQSLNDQSIQKINLSNNSYQNGINTNPNSNNNSFLARKASKKSNYINYPTHSKRKYDQINTSGKKDSSQQDNSLILTKENNLDSQPHYIGSPLSPSGVIEHFSHKNSITQEFNGKNIYKQDEIQIYANTQNNNNNSLGSTMQSNQNKNNNNSNKYGSAENSHQKNPLSISNNKNSNFNSTYLNYSKSVNAEHPFKRVESTVSSPNHQINKNYNQIISSNQNNPINKENILVANNHKDNLGRSQSAGLVNKKKIFNQQNFSNSPNIQKENKKLQNSPILMSNETFQVDNKLYETKQKFQEENQTPKVNQLLFSGIEINQKIQVDSAQILKSDEDNLKKYIQLQNEINNSQTEVKQMKEESKSINLQNYKDARKNSKEIVLNQNKIKPGENVNKVAYNNAIQLSQNQEKSLKKTAAEYLMQKASKQQLYSNSYNISGFTPQHIINRNQPSQQNLNYFQANQKASSTLPTNHDLRNKITKYSDNFIKKKSLPTYQNTQQEENLLYQNYLVKSKLNSNNIQRNNFAINLSNPNQINGNNSLNHVSKYNEANKEKQKTPRMKIFDHETSQNHSFNRDRSRDISPNRNMIFNQPYLSKSPIGRDLDEKEGILSANNSIELRNSPFVSKNPQFKTQKQPIQLMQKQPLDSLTQLEPCDISEASIANQNIPKQTLDSKHDKTQTYFSKVKNENKYDGIQQHQQVQEAENKINEVKMNNILEKQIYPLVVSEQFKQMYNKESSNYNQIVNTINHKKNGMLGSPTSQDNYLDQKYNRNNKNFPVQVSVSNNPNNNNIFTPRVTSHNEFEKKNSIQSTPQQLNTVTNQNQQINKIKSDKNLQQLFFYCKFCQIFTRDSLSQHEILCSKQMKQMELMQKSEQISFINSRIKNVQEFQTFLLQVLTTKKLIFYTEFHDENLKEILQNNENVEKMQNTYQDLMLLFERVQSFILQQQQQNNQQISQQQQLYNKNFLQLIETTILLAFQKLRAIAL